MAEKSWATKVRETQVWKSIFRHGPPDNARNRAAVVAGNVFLHLHPIKLKKSGVQLGYTWCMGGLSCFSRSNCHRCLADVLLQTNIRVCFQRYYSSTNMCLWG